MNECSIEDNMACTSTKICNNACNVASERLKRWQNTTAYQAMGWTSWKQCTQKTKQAAVHAKDCRKSSKGEEKQRGGTMATVMSLGRVEVLGGVEMFV